MAIKKQYQDGVKILKAMLCSVVLIRRIATKMKGRNIYFLSLEKRRSQKVGEYEKEIPQSHTADTYSHMTPNKQLK